MYEEKVYLALLSVRHASAKDLAARSSVPPTAVYPTLASLVKKGFAQRVDGDITAFEILPPRTAILTFMKQKEKSLRAITDHAIDLAESIPTTFIQPPPEVIRISEGIDISLQIYLDAILKTKSSFHVLGWRFEKVKDKYNILHLLTPLVKKGIDVRIILTGSRQKKWDLIESYERSGVRMRYLPQDGFSIFIRDGEECKLTIKNKESPSRYNVRILDGSLSLAMQQYFLDCWKRAEMIPMQKKN